MKNEELYSYSANEKIIEQLLRSNDSFTYCGLPLIGKTRVLKKVLAKLELIDNTEFINLSTVKNEDINASIIKNIIDQLEISYSKGKRVFVLSSAPLDSEYSEDLIKQLFQFRQSKLQFPILIPLFCTHPTFYNEITHFADRIFNTIVIENIQNKLTFDFLIKQNEARYCFIINEDQKNILWRLTGGIAILIKEVFKQYTINNFSFENSENNQFLDYAVKEILDQIPNKEIDLYLRMMKHQNVTEFEKDYLLKIGLINTNGKFTSSMLLNGLLKYKRSYPFYLLNDTIYINAKASNKSFSQKEYELLKLIMKEKEISRSTVQGLIKNGSNKIEVVSEYSTDKFISRLRKKLEKLGVNKDCIQTQKGKGYIFKQDEP